MRARRPWPLVCLVVGYTNVGKSTLLNAFCGDDAYVDNRLFSTLDTKTRLVKLTSERSCLLTDTVDFIHDLPHGLVASFRSTLDVLAEADLLLVVADTSHDKGTNHLAVVDTTLEEIGVCQIPSILIFNKIDTVSDKAMLDSLKAKHPEAFYVSAQRSEGLSALRDGIANAVPTGMSNMDVKSRVKSF